MGVEVGRWRSEAGGTGLERLGRSAHTLAARGKGALFRLSPVRVPFYGAIATLSKFGKKYEMGEYQVGPTTLFVTRGIGFEPYPAPRVRFLCRPEIVVIDLVGRG